MDEPGADAVAPPPAAVGAHPVGVRASRNGAVLVVFTGITNLADGIAKVALPLVATQLTSSPALIAGVALCLSLPWLLTAMHVGVLVDRADRRRLMLVGNLLRIAAVAGLLASAATASLSIAAIYAAAVVLGVADVLALTAGAALIPDAVPPGEREQTNARITAAETVFQEFVGPPVGGLLVGLGVAVALGATAAAYVLGLLLIRLLVGSFAVPLGAAERRG